MCESGNKRWQYSPPGANWGEFGDNDVLGRVNLLDGRKLQEGLAEITQSRSFALGLPLDVPGAVGMNPNRLPPVMRPTLREGRPGGNIPIEDLHEGYTDILNDDVVILHPQFSSHWDAFGHFGGLFDVDGDGTSEHVFYNGYHAGEHVLSTDKIAECGVPGVTPELPLSEPTELRTTKHLGPVGIGHVAQHGIQGRAVLVDLKKHYGVERRGISLAEILEVAKKDGITFREGDIVMFHTGYAEALLQGEEGAGHELAATFGTALNGRDPELLEWITDSRIAAIAADNVAVELFPSPAAEPPASWLPMHEHCLFKLGIPLGELWYLSELAAAMGQSGQYSCLLVAPPLNLPGAAGSPVNPIAII